MLLEFGPDQKDLRKKNRLSPLLKKHALYPRSRKTAGTKRETNMKKILIGAALATMTAFGATSAQACGKVSITEMDWASSQVVTAVATFLMQQGYGCDVQKVPSSTVPALMFRTLNTTV